MFMVHAGAQLAKRPGAFPPRPGFGTSGRPIQLAANFFEVHIPPNMTLFHYDVEIQPSKVPRQLKQMVMQAAVRQDPRFSGQCPVFDGEKNMYCHKKLPEAMVHGTHTNRNFCHVYDTYIDVPYVCRYMCPSAKTLREIQPFGL